MNVALPVHALCIDERPRVAEVPIEVQRVRADCCRQQDQRGERVQTAPVPEENHERRQKREPDQACPAREPAEHAGDERTALRRGKERTGGEREEEPVRVRSREDERDRVQRDEQDGVVRAALAEQRTREAMEHDDRDGRGGERDEHGRDDLRTNDLRDTTDEQGVDR